MRESFEKKENQDVYLIGGSDLEMYQIKKKLSRSGNEYEDKNLKWGAKLEDYKDEIEKILSEEKVPVAIELLGADKNKNVVDIDHHGEKANRPAAISQVMERIGLKMSFIDELIAANDNLYISGIEAKIEEHRTDFEKKYNTEAFEIFKNKLVNLIRGKDRQIQGITLDQEKEAEEAIRHKERFENLEDLIIVRMSHSKIAPVADRLFSEQFHKKGQNLLVLSEEKNEVNYVTSKHIELCKELVKHFGGWSGGESVEGKKTINGYWGINNESIPTMASQEEIVEFVKNYFSVI